MTRGFIEVYGYGSTDSRLISANENTLLAGLMYKIGLVSDKGTLLASLSYCLWRSKY